MELKITLPGKDEIKCRMESIQGIDSPSADKLFLRLEEEADQEFTPESIVQMLRDCIEECDFSATTSQFFTDSIFAIISYLIGEGGIDFITAVEQVIFGGVDGSFSQLS